MFDDLRLRINDALQQRLGVDVPTAANIIFESGQEAQLRSQGGAVGAGQIEFATGTTLPGQFARCKEEGAQQIEVIVFSDLIYHFPDGSKATFKKVRAKYPIR